MTYAELLAQEYAPLEMQEVFTNAIEEGLQRQREECAIIYAAMTPDFYAHIKQAILNAEVKL